MVAVTSGVSLEARRGPLRCGTSALTPAADSVCAQRQRVNGEVPNAAATCTWVAALIRINDTAANRRPAVSPPSQVKARWPCTKTRPPCSSSIIAAAALISVAPVGNSGKGGWVVITVILAPPNPPENTSQIISRPGWESTPTHRQIRSSQHTTTDRTRTPLGALGMEPDGIPELAGDGQFGAQGGGVLDGEQVRVFGLEVGVEALDPGLIGRRSGPSEVLGDRAQRHELPGGSRRHLRAVIGHRKQDRPSLVVSAEVHEPVGASLDGLQQSLGVECVGESDLDLGGGFLSGDDLGDPLARDQILRLQDSRYGYALPRAYLRPDLRLS